MTEISHVFARLLALFRAMLFAISSWVELIELIKECVCVYSCVRVCVASVNICIAYSLF